MVIFGVDDGGDDAGLAGNGDGKDDGDDSWIYAASVINSMFELYIITHLSMFYLNTVSCSVPLSALCMISPPYYVLRYVTPVWKARILLLSLIRYKK